MSEKSTIYQTGEYLKNNPDWHSEDSPWKAKKILRILERNNIDPKSVCEIGCGAGGILKYLHSSMEKVEFTGYEISKDAFEFCKTLQRERLTFKFEDLLADNNPDYYDLLLCCDVFEHVEDHFKFLRRIKEKAQLSIFLIPLELSVISLLFKSRLLESRKKFGHIHYFSKETALATLKETGFSIIDYSYTNRTFECHVDFSKRILNIFRRLLNFNKDFSVRLLGGEHLLVLAK
jgi:predicted TPR repeat methyltransferase